MIYEEDLINLTRWLSSFDDNVIFCSGAFGDFFLGVDFALKYNYPMIYWSKKETFEISKKFLEAFEIKNYIINVGKEIWRDKETNLYSCNIEKLLNNRGFKTHGNNKCNLPLIKYLPLIVNQQYSNFHEYKLNIPEKYCLICPSGGNSNPKILRFFYPEEFNHLAICIKRLGIEPIIVGSENQLKKFDNKKKYKWLQFEKFENEKIEIKYFIEAVKSSMFVISPDTSIKTLSAAMHIPTIVLKNRNNKNEYINGPWDRIFLDNEKWKTLECIPFENILRKFDKNLNLKMI